MKKFLSLNVLLVLSLLSFSQNPMQGQGGNRGGMGGGQMPAGRFYGKIVDAKTGKAIEYASIELFQNKFDTVTKQRKETLITGMLTKANGDFSLENVPAMGQSKLKITAIGYKDQEKQVSFDLKNAAGNMMNALDKDLGNFKMEIDDKVLSAVTVSASRSALTLAADKKIFNVDKNLVSAGGTAEDVMKNVPSVQVDLDGNVTLRNNTPTIFVDNRPTTLSLDQIPADAIESIEIITNPSAKYDASGGQAGILNIVLKKNRKAGYNGSIRANVDSRARVGLSGDINVRTEKINMFLNGNYNQRKSISTGETERTTLIGTPNTYLLQNDRSVSLGNMRGIRAGFDYFWNNRNSITLSGNMFRGGFEPESNSNIFIDSLYSVKTSSFSNRTASSENEFKNKGAQVGYKHLFPKAGREWTADINYNSGRNSNNNLISTSYYTYPQNSLISSNVQRQRTAGKNENVVFQSDFINPLTDKSKMEMGVRFQVRDINSDQGFYFVNPNGLETYIPTLSTRYTSRDRVYAAYGTYSNQIKNFNYQVGLRVESSDYNGILPDKNQDFNIEFPVSLFPSLGFTAKLKKDQDLQFNYSRRINRPGFFQLFPFTDYSDSLNVSRGNPNLKPEFTNSAELSYSKTFENRDNLLISYYYKRTENLITRNQQQEVNPYNNKDVLVNTFINANNSYVTGLEIVSKNKITKWWDLTSNLNLFTSKINIDDPSVTETDQFASWFAKINNSFKLPKNFSVQLSGEYQSKTVLPPGGSGGGGMGGFGGGGGRGGGGMHFGGPQSTAQGFNYPNYYVDMAVRFEFMKEKRASISVNWNDIFKTRRNYVYSESQYFTQTSFRRRDPQMVRINFNWRFGKFDMNLFKRKNTRSEGDGSEGMMQ